MDRIPWVILAACHTTLVGKSFFSERFKRAALDFFGMPIALQA